MVCRQEARSLVHLLEGEELENGACKKIWSREWRKCQCLKMRQNGRILGTMGLCRLGFYDGWGNTVQGVLSQRLLHFPFASSKLLPCRK